MLIMIMLSSLPLAVTLHIDLFTTSLNPSEQSYETTSKPRWRRGGFGLPKVLLGPLCFLYLRKMGVYGSVWITGG